MTARFLSHVLACPVSAAKSMLVAALMVAAAGCVAPAPDASPAVAAADPGAEQRDAASTSLTPAAAPRTAPPMSDPLPPLRVPERDAQRVPREGVVRAPVAIDTSCTRDADCTIKNVGNCCGHYPACVNVDSPTDPEAVQAQCARTGMASVCGFPSISACQCVAGQCRGDNAAVER